MPQNARVLVCFGPYEAYGVAYRKDRLVGLETSLFKDGHEVEFDEIEDWNCVELWVNGEKVFNCNITDLDYGSDGILDKRVEEAVEAVRNAF